MSQFPLDYVFAGANVYYQVTVGGWRRPPTWNERFNYLRQIVSSHYRINKYEENETSGSIFFNLTIPGDMRSINDVKATMDGAVYTASYPYRGSMVRFLHNPRRDGTIQPPVNTPGVPPPVTQLPPGAGNVNTNKGSECDLFCQISGLFSGAQGFGLMPLLIGGAVLVLLLKR